MMLVPFQLFLDTFVSIVKAELISIIQITFFKKIGASDLDRFSIQFALASVESSLKFLEGL